MRRTFPAFAACVLLVFSIALADKPFDAVTGRDTRTYAPDPEVNFTNIALDIAMPDPLSRSFTCDETITFAAPSRPIERLDLNAVDLQIAKVTDLNDRALSFRYDQKMLIVRFDPPLAPLAESGLKVHYVCDKPKMGLNFALPDDKYPDRPVSIHSQGETETNRYWFICHDYPNCKQTSEISITIPAKYQALSNGALVSKEDADNGQVKYHYKISHPHAAYLVSLIVGEFSVVKDEWHGKPVEYWVPKSHEKNAKRSFGRTPEMIELFSRLTHFDYPWEKYSQAVVYNFGAGGMENTSCTTLTEIANLDERGAIDSDLEGLVSHELGHQWFGDTITCKSWPHTWLNEGWATFMDAVWHENAHGLEAYEHQIWQGMQGVAKSDDPTAKGGVVWFNYNDGGEIFGRAISNPYGKGSVVIHMLRRSLGDELFWNVVGTYLQRNAFKCVETDDLRKVCDELSGKSYEQFFQQWLYRAGTPKIGVDYEWDDAQKNAVVTFEQTQAINENAPAFSADVPISFDGAIHVLSMKGRTAKLSVQLDHEPKWIAIDPDGTLLAKWSLDLPRSMLIDLAKSGPTPFARYNAISTLSEHDQDDVREALRTILLDDSQDETYRSEAAAALGRMQTNGSRDLLLDALATDHFIKEPHVRRAAVEAMGSYNHASVVPTLLRFAKSDETYTVEAVASDALGKQDPTDAIIQQLLANLKKPSFREQIRMSALQSLGEIGDQRAMKPAMELAGYGNPYRLRPAAIEAVGKIGRQLKDKVEARRFLVALLNDPQDRAAGSAIHALGKLGDEDAIPALQTLAAGSAAPQMRDAAKNAIEEITRHDPADAASIKSLRTRIEALEKAREESKKLESRDRHEEKN